HQLVRRRLFVRLHQGVDVRTEHERLPPVRHREVGIEPRRFAKRPSRLGVVERIRQVQALIHEHLRLPIARRHGERMAPEILQAGCERARRRGLWPALIAVVNVTAADAALPERLARTSAHGENDAHAEQELLHTRAPLILWRGYTAEGRSIAYTRRSCPPISSANLQSPCSW